MIHHLADLESDFSAIHRVDDMYELPGPRFMQLAYRMAAYEGVMKVRYEIESEQQKSTGDFVPSASSDVTQHGPIPDGARVVPLSVLMLETQNSGEWIQDAG